MSTFTSENCFLLLLRHCKLPFQNGDSSLYHEKHIYACFTASMDFSSDNPC